MKIPLRFVVPALVFAALVGFFIVGLRLNPGEIQSPLIGKPAPARECASSSSAGRVCP